MSIEAMKLALEALEWNLPVIEDYGDKEQLNQQHKAITALRAALAEQAQPVACDKDPRGCWSVRCQLGKVCKNTAPPSHQPLTDEEIMANAVLRYHFALNGGEGPLSKQGRKIIDAIEAAHGITSRNES